MIRPNIPTIAAPSPAEWSRARRLEAAFTLGSAAGRPGVAGRAGLGCSMMPWLWLVLGLCVSGCTTRTPASDPHRLAERNPQPMTSPYALDLATRVAAVDTVLALIDRHHVDAIDSPRLAAWRAALLPAGLDLPETAFWQLLDAQLSELADSHTRLQSPAEVLTRTNEPHPGLRTRREADGSLRVTDVEPGSPAQGLGIGPGWRVLALNGRPVQDIWATRPQRAESSPRAAEQRGLRQLWHSAPAPWMVELSDPYGRHHVMQLEPASPPQASYRRDAERVLELRLPHLDDAALGEAERALRERPAPSLVVLDLRGSRGGAGAIALRVMELFVQGEHDIARVETRDGEPIRQGGHTVVPLAQRIQGRDLYAGPMAVLIDAATASSSELLAGGLQLLDRAPLIGEISCGCMNPSFGWFALPGGAQLLISEARLPLADGRRIERVGLQPDHRSEYSDAPLEARRLLLPSQTRAPL